MLISAAIGGLFWMIAAGLSLLGRPLFAPLELLILLAVLALTPLVLYLADADDSLAAYTQPAGAVAVIAAFLLPTSLTAGLLAGVWLLVTGLVALIGAQRLLMRPPIAEVALNMALVYLPVGAMWLLADRIAFTPLHFDSLIVTLTAAHFHYIPLAALTLTAMVGRHIEGGRLYQMLAISVIAAPMVVAAGITFSLFLEVVGAVWLAGGMITIAALTLLRGLPEHRVGRVLIALSALAVLFPMALAVLYPLGRWLGAWEISIPYMIRWHGWVNALGFGTLGLVGWVLTTER